MLYFKTPDWLGSGRRRSRDRRFNEESDMKITKQPREATVCDTCRREGYLQKCVICGGDFCTDHQVDSLRSWIKLQMCQSCGGDDGIMDAVTEFAGRVREIISAAGPETADLTR